MPVEITCRNCKEKRLVKPFLKNTQFCNNDCRKEFKDKQHSKEAEEVGATLIGKGKNTYYRTYKLDCGHIRELQPYNVRINSFECLDCIEERILKDAEVNGLEHLGKAETRGYRIFRWKECSHKQTIRVDHLYTATCDECYKLQLANEAEAQSFSIYFDGKYPNKNYQCHKCGSIQLFNIFQMRLGAVRCGGCQQKKLDDEAEAIGATIIGKGKNARYRRYKFNDCGHEREMLTGSVREGYAPCDTCEELSYDLPSKVYLLKLKHKDLTWLKLGHAKKVSTRIKEYGLIEGVKVETLIAIDFDTGREAGKYEYNIGKELKKYKYGQKKMKEYMTHSGFTECFKTKAQDLLMSRIMQSEIDLRSTS
jgi:hypothetical protein